MMPSPKFVDKNFNSVIKDLSPAIIEIFIWDFEISNQRFLCMRTENLYVKNENL